MNLPSFPRTAGDVVRVRPAAAWAEHFRANVRRDWQIPWHAAASLPPAIDAEIAASIAQFQRGKSAAAPHYLAQSQGFSESVGDPAFHDASILFVREENAHGALLLRFLRQTGTVPAGRSFCERVFRRLRSLGDLGWSSRVLIVAALIGREYYPSLRAATTHPVLVRICDRIIGDEDAHLRFHVERITRSEARRSASCIRRRDLLQTVLVAGAAGVAYLGHRRVLNGMGLFEFLRRSLLRNRNVIAALWFVRDAAGLDSAAVLTCSPERAR